MSCSSPTASSGQSAGAVETASQKEEKEEEKFKDYERIAGKYVAEVAGWGRDWFVREPTLEEMEIFDVMRQFGTTGALFSQSTQEKSMSLEAKRFSTHFFNKYINKEIIICQ